MIDIIWEFEIHSAEEYIFQEIYGKNGKWAQLFRKSTHDHETLLIKDHKVPKRYLTIDRWDTLENFEEFKLRHQSAYHQLDRECEKLTIHENLIGIFEDLSFFP